MSEGVREHLFDMVQHEIRPRGENLGRKGVLPFNFSICLTFSPSEGTTSLGGMIT
jgi:hypothetical protein